MKKIITAFIFCFLFGECFSQAGEWVWIKGDSVPNQSGNFGVQGVPSPTNNPPSLYEACEWTDLNGNFWLFGGLGIAGIGGDVFNTLWKLDPTTNEWTWMKGWDTYGAYGNYGVQGVPSPTNDPPSRGYGVTSWVDTLGNLWMFGGLGASGSGSYCDLWKYTISTNEWTWMKGPNTIGQVGIYGVKGVADPYNHPGARWESATGWTDANNNLWLFGGLNANLGNFNDLWRYNISSNEWTWMKGSKLTNQAGVYGTKGVEAAKNKPGARLSYTHWKDNSGRLWLFGSEKISPVLCYSDVWRYNPVTDNWAWMGGDSVANVTASYGTRCVALAGNNPGVRYENRSVWKDQSGDFWFFGGMVTPNCKNDLWKYCVGLKEWIWESGDSASVPSGSWGSLNVSDATNKPDGRMGAAGWKNNDNHLYLYGGYNAPNFYYNDLWKYTIDTTCGVCAATTSVAENIPPEADELFVFPNPANASLTISFSSSEKQLVELRIYNTLGKEVYFSKEEISTGKFEKEINVVKPGEGIYFLQVKLKDRVVSKKVVVEK